MPKTTSVETKAKTEETASQPYTKIPIMLIHASRKILVPRRDDYDDMKRLSRSKIHSLRGVPLDHLAFLSSMVPGFEGTKVEISRELWPEVVGKLKAVILQEIPEARAGTLHSLGIGCTFLGHIAAPSPTTKFSMGAPGTPNFIRNYDAFLTRWGISDTR